MKAKHIRMKEMKERRAFIYAECVYCNARCAN
jgi:hypothetical protein